PGQDEEGRLEGVLGILLVVEHAPADAQDHRPMTADQGGEGGFVTAGGEVVQKLLIGPLQRTAADCHSAEVLQNHLELCRGHVRSSPVWGSLPYSCRRPGNRSLNFTDLTILREGRPAQASS